MSAPSWRRFPTPIAKQVLLILLPLMATAQLHLALEQSTSISTVIIARDFDSAVQRNILEDRAPDGTVSYTTNQFVVLENNVHYRENGDWKQSEDVIALVVLNTSVHLCSVSVQTACRSRTQSSFREAATIFTSTPTGHGGETILPQHWILTMELPFGLSNNTLRRSGTI